MHSSANDIRIRESSQVLGNLLRNLHSVSHKTQPHYIGGRCVLCDCLDIQTGTKWNEQFLGGWVACGDFAKADGRNVFADID